MSREVILSAENGGKPLGSRALPRTPLGELTALPRPLDGGEGAAAAPSPRTQPPPSAIGFGPNEKYWTRPFPLSNRAPSFVNPAQMIPEYIAPDVATVHVR